MNQKDVEQIAEILADGIIKKFPKKQPRKIIPFPQESIDEDGSITLGGSNE